MRREGRNDALEVLQVVRAGKGADDDGEYVRASVVAEEPGHEGPRAVVSEYEAAKGGLRRGNHRNDVVRAAYLNARQIESLE